ncbi:MAG: adenine phosphoribosyltransferase [Candidatus Obscuribacterales bacterium]
MSTQLDKSKLAKLSLPLNDESQDLLKSKIRDIPDFPKPGIIFKDLTPLLKDVEAFTFAMQALTEKCRSLQPKYIAGIEARGFILGPIIAYNLGVGFIPIRKPGKLPYEVQKLEYALEYGSDCIEVHADAVEKDDRVVLIDDLLATGGTAGAADKLMKVLGANVVGIGFIVELAFLNGRANLPHDAELFSLITY